MPEAYDVIIIGGGPAGATAALYTARAELKTLVIDKNVSAGALGITSQIANYPGVPEVITGVELLQRMWKQAESHGAVFKRAKVVGVSAREALKTVTTAEGETFEGRSLILATGAMGRGQVLPGEQEFLGRGVSYCGTCDAAFFRNKDVAVIGSNAETVDEAMFLTRFVRTLHLVTPKPRLEASDEAARALLSKPQVKTRFGVRPTSIVGNGVVTGIKLSAAPGTEELLPVNGVFIFTAGNKPIVDYLQGEVETAGQGCILVNRQMETPLPGVFACGDVLCNDVQQAVVAAAQGCIAALACDRFLHGRKTFAKDYQK